MIFKELPRTSKFFDTGYTHQKWDDFPSLPEDGSWYQFHHGGWARRLPDGSEEIVTQFGSAISKNPQHFQKKSSRVLGEPGYDMAHAQGRITGVESPYGLGLVHRKVNQEFQRLGIEDQINKIQQEKPEHIDLYLKTTVKNEGRYLKKIDYHLESIDRDQQQSFTLFTADITIDREHSSGVITVTQLDPKSQNLHSEHKQEFCHSFRLNELDKNQKIGEQKSEVKKKNKPRLAEKKLTKAHQEFEKER